MMQPFPNQPMNQPTYPPAEIYVPEQPQTYAPYQESPQAQEIAIYLNRRQAIARTTICVIGLLIIVLLIPAMVILSTLAGDPPGIGDIVPLLIIVIPASAFIGWISWTMLSMVSAHKPVLIINREGIVVSPMPMLSGFSISWGEIEALFPTRYMYKYFCIAPRNRDYFLKAHFNGFERLNRRMNSLIGSPLYVPMVYLDKPVEEILQQLYYMYAKELSYYRIQIRS